MAFEQVWSEIGRVLCTLVWNSVWLLDETIYYYYYYYYSPEVRCVLESLLRSEIGHG